MPAIRMSIPERVGIGLDYNQGTGSDLRSETADIVPNSDCVSLFQCRSSPFCRGAPRPTTYTKLFRVLRQYRPCCENGSGACNLMKGRRPLAGLANSVLCPLQTRTSRWSQMRKSQRRRLEATRRAGRTTRQRQPLDPPKVAAVCAHSSPTGPPYQRGGRSDILAESVRGGCAICHQLVRTTGIQWRSNFSANGSRLPGRNRPRTRIPQPGLRHQCCRPSILPHVPS
jgi:hypothetical protein